MNERTDEQIDNHTKVHIDVQLHYPNRSLHGNDVKIPTN